jgi:hypothetical protein
MNENKKSFVDLTLLLHQKVELYPERVISRVVVANPFVAVVRFFVRFFF